MKNIIAAICCFSLLASATFAQEHKPQEATTDSLPYLLYPDLPAFNIRLMDSFNVFNTYNIQKGKPTLLIVFDPDCKHCQAMTKTITAGMDSLKDIDMYWFTPNPSMTLLRKFYQDYHLADYKNIKVVGRDYEFFFSDFYKVSFVPDIALYDADKRFVKLFQNRVKVSELYEYTHKR